MRVWTGFNWLRIRTSVWTFGFHKYWGISWTAELLKNISASWDYLQRGNSTAGQKTTAEDELLSEPSKINFPQWEKTGILNGTCSPADGYRRFILPPSSGHFPYWDSTFFWKSRDSSVSIVTRLWAGKLKDQTSCPGRVRYVFVFYHLQTVAGHTLSPIQCAPGLFVQS
jgi:hypothetical protein